jgi:hypothetical protein
MCTSHIEPPLPHASFRPTKIYCIHKLVKIYKNQ